MKNHAAGHARSIITHARLAGDAWGLRIILAEQRDAFTPQDQQEAGGWVNWLTHGCTASKRRFEGDPALRLLGRAFEDHVRDQEYIKAANVYVQMKRRAGVLEER